MIQTVDVSEIHVLDGESSDSNEKYPKHSTPIKNNKSDSKKKRGLLNSSGRAPRSPNRTKTHGSYIQDQSLSMSSRAPRSPNRTKTQQDHHGSYTQDQSLSASSRAPNSPNRTKTQIGSSVQQWFPQDQSSIRSSGKAPNSPTRTKAQNVHQDQSLSRSSRAPVQQLYQGSSQYIYNTIRSRDPPDTLSHNYNTSLMSTPVKDKADTSQYTVQPTSPGQSSLESSTILKQREEIKLLMNELKDRDQELNEMVSAHQHQLISWQTDRKKIVMLEQKCRKFKNDVSSRNELLEKATSRLEDLEMTCSTQLESNKVQLTQLIQDKDSQTNLLISLGDRNKSLNDSLREVSSTVGELAAREQEMVTLLKLKDNEIRDLKEKYGDLFTKYKQLEQRNTDCHTRERDAFGQSSHWQDKYNKSLCEIEKLKVDVDERDEVLTQQIAQINEAQQHMIALQEALIATNEREKSKDELITSLKSKEERRISELRSVRELYERQQRELTMLQMNLDTSQLIEQSAYLVDSQQYDNLVDANIPELDISYDSTIVNQQITFDNRLSRFLNTSITRDGQSTNNNNNTNITERPTDTDLTQEEPASPGRKLQRLLTESKQLIETLEKSTLPSSPSQQQCSNQKNDTSQ